MADRSKPLLAPDRVRIYLTLVPYLAERGQVSLVDAAGDFGVSVDEMRAMAEKLTVMGLPGDNGFYQLDPDLFNINWDLLDEENMIELHQHGRARTRTQTLITRSGCPAVWATTDACNRRGQRRAG